MAKRIKHDKVIRGYDGIDREESTAGLMLLRIFLISIIILFIVCITALFIYKVSLETGRSPDESASNEKSAALYQKYNAEDEKQLLRYCSSSSPMSEYDTVELVDFKNNISVNVLLEHSLEKMIKAARADGVSIEVEEGYKSFEECNELNAAYKKQFQSEGYTAAAAELKASQLCPKGVCNEYRTGMLIKIRSDSKEDFGLTDIYTWMYKNGVEYGFINRYTDEKFEITGIEEDLTVYRFVGTENAKKMRSFNMCLEEYSNYMAAR